VSIINAFTFVLLAITLAPSVSGQQRPTVRVETLVVTQDAGEQSLFINQSGQVAGDRVVNGNLRAFRWTRQKGVLDLGTLGGNLSDVKGQDDLGEIFGVSYTADGNPHAFVWTENAGMRDLGLLPGASLDTQVYLSAVSSLGVATGCMMDPSSGSTQIFLWTRLFGPRPIVNLGSERCFVVGVNDLASVAYFRATDHLRSYRWILNGGSLELDPLSSGENTQVYAINDTNDVVGSSGNRATHWPHGGTPAVLPSLSSATSRTAMRINLHGDIAGTFAGPSASYTHAVLWPRDAAPIDLGVIEKNTRTPPDSEYSVPLAINLRSDVTGFSTVRWVCTGSPCYHGFLWTAEHGLLELDEPGGAADNRQCIATSINNSRQVVGNCWEEGNPSSGRAVLWTVE
jgi:probable HAF family extracellular repeat protein